MRYDGDPRWRHDDECSLDEPCRACLLEEEARQEPPPTSWRRDVVTALITAAAVAGWVLVASLVAAEAACRVYTIIGPSGALQVCQVCPGGLVICS